MRMPGCKIKICGVTREQDVKLIGECGADFVGLLIDMPSRRTLDEARAAELKAASAIPVALLFFDKPREDVARIAERLSPAAVQLQGHEPPQDIQWLRARIQCEIWKGVHLPALGQGQIQSQETLSRMNDCSMAGADVILLDTVVKPQHGAEQMGGTGKTFDWNAAAELSAVFPGRVMLAGGLNPENVGRAIDMVHPWGVDLASGVESGTPGVKDPDKVRAFIREVRKSDLFY
jgi:phosphoribosylanthranilate isomerase